MSVVVACKELKKTYGEKEATVYALRGVNLEVMSGELVMLVGPSGSGKTTLLSIISGILKQDSGECLLFDKPINQLSEEEKIIFRKKNIGFVFQTFHLIPSLTAVENTSIPLILNDIPPEIATKKAEDMLIQVGLKDRMHALPTHLSGGEQQRVTICRSCIHHPRLIVCDEPTSSLDHETGIKVMELLREIALDGDKALIVVTHDPRIFSFADRILKMEDGRIVGEMG